MLPHVSVLEINWLVLGDVESMGVGAGMNADMWMVWVVEVQACVCVCVCVRVCDFHGRVNAGMYM